MKIPGVDAVKTVSEFRTLLAEVTALLQECRDLLRQIRDQRDIEQNGPRG